MKLLTMIFATSAMLWAQQISIPPGQLKKNPASNLNPANIRLFAVVDGKFIEVSLDPSLVFVVSPGVGTDPAQVALKAQQQTINPVAYVPGVWNVRADRQPDGSWRSSVTPKGGQVIVWRNGVREIPGRGYNVDTSDAALIRPITAWASDDDVYLDYPNGEIR